MGLWSRISALVMVFGFAGLAGAQTLATGDSRTLTEPTFPATCTVLTAQQAIVNDAPASETLYDTSRIQAALTACPSGQAVELAGANGNFAFLSATLNIPSGVGLIVDGGVTLYASRKASDYQVTGSSETCGSYGSSGNACNYFLTFNKGSANTGSGVYGYGVIDLRGGATILSATGTDTGVSWWTNADQANTAGKSQDNVSLMKPNKSTGLIFYKITIRSSPNFHIVTSNVNGETIWGVKIQAPFTAHNTDGIDPQGTNISVINSSISDGDDAIAVSGSSASSNITIRDSNVYSSHGVSIGSYTNAGVSNMLVNRVNMAGEPTDGNETGMRIKSAADRGGVVQNITYQNMCLRDIAKPVVITPVYNTNSGTLIPSFQNIVMQNIHVLPTTKATKYTVGVAGTNANYLTTLTLNNFVSDQTLFYSPAFSYSTIALAGNVYPATLQSQSGTGVTYTGSATATATPAYDCSNTAAVFPFILGELFASTATATNLQTATISGGATVTLNAMVQPAKSQVTFNGTVGNYTGAAALTKAVNFYEGATLVGTGTLGANATNNSLATLTLSNVTAGTHTYTAQYPGDSNYNALAFGSVTVTVAAASVASTTTIAVSGTLTYGATQTMKATVTGSGGTPGGSVAFYDGAAALQSCTLSSGTCSVSTTLGGGPHVISAVYSGDATFKTSTSANSNVAITTASSTTALTANPTTVTVNGTTVLSVTVSGVSGAAVPTGTVSFTDGTSSLGNAQLDGSGTASFTATMVSPGARSVAASYAGDANYANSSASTTVTVTAASTTTTLTVPTSAAYGTPVTLSATVAAASGTPTGTVNFMEGLVTVGSATLVSGVATTSIQFPAGQHFITANYAGDAAGLYATSASTTQQINETQGTAVITVSAAPTTVTANSSTLVTVTLAGTPGGDFPTGSITLTDTTGGGSISLGAVLLTNGIGSTSVTLANLGSRSITARYTGNTNYGAVQVSTSVFVTALIPTTTLTASPTTASPGASVTLTATTSPAVAGATVTFQTVTTMIGPATTNASGVATITWVPTTTGTYSVVAIMSPIGIYGRSQSNTVSFVVAVPLTVAATPNPIAITAGGSGTVAIALTPGGGFSSALTATCTSPVSYVVCTPSSGTLAAGATSSSVNITVAATIGAVKQTASTLQFALMGVLGLAGIGLRRKRFARLAAFALLAGVMGLVGCGGSTSSSGGGSTGTRPSGSQTVTYTVAGGGATVATAITVNIQ